MFTDVDLNLVFEVYLFNLKLKMYFNVFPTAQLMKP